MLFSAEVFKTLFDDAMDGLLVIQDGVFIECNDAAVKMLGYDTPSELYLVHFSTLSPEFQEDGKSSCEASQEMMQIALTKGQHRFNWQHKKKMVHLYG